MIPELGHFALWLVLVLALALALVPALGVWRDDQLLMAFAPRLAAAQLLFVSLAFALLAYAFLSDDFSVRYVANNSNSALPLHFKFSAIWGAHEGSALLWLLMISAWTQLVASLSGSLPPSTRARILAVLGLLCFGFALFSVATSNPFARILPFAPFEGADLNPQLQDIGLILHPPMLYVGYIGFSVIFAVALAALWQGEFNHTLVQWARPWVSISWAFLGVGIVLGSWWAYYELGWGGWWFWDAVENASFMPWLAGAALLHSLAVTEKRNLFQGWSLLLAILTFSLSMLGAFIVRSGVLTSVHAFAQDPKRGLFILIFLGLISGGALLLYALRINRITGLSPLPNWLSRETLLMVNNLLLIVATATVLLGTLFPLAYEALNDGAKLSVGPPYFNRVFLPLMALLMVAIAVGPFTTWQQTHDWQQRLKPLIWVALASLLVGLLSFWWTRDWQLLLAMSLSLWVVLASCLHMLQRLRAKDPGRSVMLYGGMWLAHIGLAVAAFGTISTSLLSKEKSLYLEAGQQTTLAGYQFQFLGTQQRDGPNYKTLEATLAVTSNTGGERFLMKPEKRFYPTRKMNMTEAAIDAGFWRDLYIALGTQKEGSAAYAVRIQHKPFVRWIWLGGLMMAFGAVLAWLGRSLAERLKETPGT